ncbi:MAG TPA: hypothetical protein VFS11_03140 [Gemmatimonadales bacterium]|nr:hypothetical protein [Gemmatimonadales bacterium]
MVSVGGAETREAIDESGLKPGPTILPRMLLPAMHLVSTATGVAVDLRAARGPQALVAMHSVACDACRRYVREELAAGAQRMAEWGGRLSVVVPGRLGDAADFAETTTDALQVLVDAEETFTSNGAMVVVADQWGEVYFVAAAGAGHDLPSREEVVAWVRFLAIQCPECEGPEGEWKTA